MEKSRAIELLKLAVPIKALTQQEYSDFVEAVNMGMDALEQPTSPDMIDRKAALDALRRCQTYLFDARDPELKIELNSAEAAINNLSPVQPVAPTESHTSKWHDLIKDPTDLPEMHDAGILKRLGIKMTSDRCFATILCDDGTRIVDVSAHLRDGKWHTDTGRWINVSGHKSEVVAWMPVIEPYRPEERKDGEANAGYRD